MPNLATMEGWLRFAMGHYTLRNVTSPFGHFCLGWIHVILIRTRESRINVDFIESTEEELEGIPLIQWT